MTPPQEPRTGGVAVRRAAIDSDWAGEAFFTRRLRNPFSKDEWVDTHIAVPLAEDEAREAVVAAARESLDVDPSGEAADRLFDALDRLDALTKRDA